MSSTIIYGRERNNGPANDQLLIFYNKNSPRFYIYKMKRQATEQEIKKILEETERLKTKYFPVYKLLKKKKLKFKHARVGDSPVEYCRIDELEKVVNDHHDQFRELVGNDTPLETLKKLFLYFNRPINAPSLKYPKILEQTSTPSQFASFPFNT